ncbi:MAG: AMP-binding protein [Lachnospiraceae bacterium]|nr:AMP-binding protein [Lachnospiraceae bacterium]
MAHIYEDYYREITDSEGNVTGIETRCPDNFNFAYDVLDRYASERPDGIALVHRSTMGTVTRFTFADMKRLSDKAANALKELGIGPGMPVFLLLKRRYEFWIAILAIHKLGAVAVPTSHMVSAEDIAERTRAAGAKAVICVNSEGICEKVEEALRGTDILPIVAGEPYGTFLRFGELTEAASDAWKRTKTHVSDPMLYYFTSGTNGAPKAVIHDHTYPIAHIYTAKNWHGVSEGDLHLAVADTGWAKTAWGKLYGQWFMGGAIMVFDYDRFYAGEMLKLLEEQKVNTFCAPPTIYKYFVLEDLTKYDLSHLRFAATAGEPMPYEVAKKFKEATGVTVRDGFGQSETVLLICTPVGKTAPAGSLGKASPQFRLELRDEDGNPVADGEEGEITVVPSDGKRPAGILSGYLGDPALYKEVWRGGVYHTGDRARCDADGFFYYIGRTDDVIKSSGYRIGPSEVEDLLMRSPTVKECAVTGYPSKTRGTVVKASVVLKDGYEGDAKLKKELQEIVKKYGAIYKYPRIIEFVDDLPRSASGKISRAKIRERDAVKAAAE